MSAAAANERERETARIRGQILNRWQIGNESPPFPNDLHDEFREETRGREDKRKTRLLNKVKDKVGL